MSSKNGFSLIEILISIAFVSAVAFVGIGWLNLLNKGSINSNETAAIDNSIKHVRFAMGDDERYCKLILGTQADGSARPFDLGNANGVSIPSIDYYNVDTSTKGPNILSVGGTLKNSNGPTVLPGSESIAVKSIALKPVSIVSATTGVASLEIIFAKSSSSEVVRTMPIFVTVAGGVLSKCSAVATTSMVLGRKCQIAGGGYADYDEATGTCVANSTTTDWVYSGDPNSATCPPGSVPAADPNDPAPEQSVCRSEATFATPLPPRTYGGTTDTSPDMGWRVAWDKNTKSCKFSYVVGASPVQGKTGILCSKATGSSK